MQVTEPKTNKNQETMLRYFPPMGVYETLFEFMDATGTYMGEPGTHPWAQGFPLTTQLPGGPELPGQVEFGSADLKYPQAAGTPRLQEAIRDYYNHFYDAGISAENVAVFAGGRPGIFAAVSFTPNDVNVLIEETEYTPYYDLLQLIDRPYTVVQSNSANQFRPTLDDYKSHVTGSDKRYMIVKSNPCNPTGVTWRGDQLRELVEWIGDSEHGGLIDEAYEFFNEPGAESAIQYVKDIEKGNLFIVGAATKGLQVPGMRVGWVVSSKKNVEIFRNYSSIGMGGVARPSQIYVANLLDIPRVTHARDTVQSFYNDQRDFYRDGLSELGIELFTGDGGFYHWGQLPNGLTAKQFNQRLFKHQAAILPGTLCDMNRVGPGSEHDSLIRFSFGPLPAETREENIKIIKQCLAE